MKVRITDPLHKALPLLEKPPFSRHHREGYRTYYNLDISQYKLESIQKLYAEVAKLPDSIRGVSNLCNDLANWIHWRKNPGSKVVKVKARRVDQARDLLIELLKRYPRKHLYQRLNEAKDGVTLTYYVNKVVYHNATTYNPEHVTLYLLYQEFGVNESETLSLYRSDILGRTPLQMLNDNGLMLETTGLREDYEFFLETFSNIYQNIGEQYLAVGPADDEGIDGNLDEDDRRWWYGSKTTNLMLDADGEPTRVVVDIFQEDPESKVRSRDEDEKKPELYFWSHQATSEEDDQEVELAEGEKSQNPDAIEIPTHPYVAAFDMKHHKRLRIHVGNLIKYEYDTSIREKLILPETNARLIDVLLGKQDIHFKDIIKGKSGGMIILCQGPPGTGKTLTAEVYAESLQRPLYTVQCSQLGVDPNDLESNLMKVLARGRRWNAVMLLDEADVYVHQRGSDLNQNAIVGVFLRVLEYHAGVLFLTTNRGDLVDDAILSRCTARIPYALPSKEDQRKIWRVMADANGIQIKDRNIKDIVSLHDLSGRDIKNLLKLAALVAHDRGIEIDEDLIAEMKQFKPTFTEGDADGE